MIEVPETIEECVMKRKGAWTEFKDTKAKSTELRDHFLDTSIKEAKDKKTTKRKHKSKRTTHYPRQ